MRTKKHESEKDLQGELQLARAHQTVEHYERKLQRAREGLARIEQALKNAKAAGTAKAPAGAGSE